MEWDGIYKITKVSIIHDAVHDVSNKGVRFFDLYVNESLTGDINDDGKVNVG